MRIEDLRNFFAENLQKYFSDEFRIPLAAGDFADRERDYFEIIRKEYNAMEFPNAVGWDVQWQGNDLVFRMKKGHGQQTR